MEKSTLFLSYKIISNTLLARCSMPPKTFSPSVITYEKNNIQQQKDKQMNYRNNNHSNSDSSIKFGSPI
jgi:hypothetical protein